MLTPHQNALVSLLLGSFSTFQSGDASAALGAYELVIADADERDIQPGIMTLINGTFAGHDGRFAPTAPQLAGAIRAARERRLESERRDGLRRPQLPPPPFEHTPESRARIAALADAAIERLGASMRTDDAAAEKRQAELTARTNARFQPDMSPEAVSRRLRIGTGRYSVGDADDDAA